MINPIQTRWAFKCQCGQVARLFEPDLMHCPNCGEIMELLGVQKVYPGFGIGTMSIKKFLRYESIKPPVDNDGEAVV